MKKNVLTLTVALIVSGVVFGAALASTYTKFSSKFIKKIRDCDEYSETITSQFEGKTFSTTRNILGWRNGFCRYEEVITSPSDSYKLSCMFSVVQIEELYEAMKSKVKEPESYDLETFIEQKDEKTGKTKYVSAGIQKIRGNKAYIAWAKYQNNPYFCRPSKLK